MSVLGGAVGGNANEQDREQVGHGQAPVSRRSFVAGVAANAPDHLLIGNATGGFTTQVIPQTATGSGEGVYPIDYNHSGLTSLLVLNGAVPYTGPVQLLTPQPSA